MSRIPLMAVMVTGKVPTGVFALVVRESVEDFDAASVMLTVEGLKLALTPVVKPPTLKATCPVNPADGASVFGSGVDLDAERGLADRGLGDRPTAGSRPRRANDLVRELPLVDAVLFQEDVVTTLPDKPVGRKSYGHIPYLLGSRVGPGDHVCERGQAQLRQGRGPLSLSRRAALQSRYVQAVQK